MRRFMAAMAATAAFVFGTCSFGAEKASALDAAPQWAPPFYAYCVEVGVPGVKTRPIAEQAKLLKELGYDGVGFPLWLDDEMDRNLAILDAAGLKLFMAYTSVNFKNAAQPYDPRVIPAIGKLQGRPTTISVLLAGLPAADPKGMEPGVKALGELGDAAAKAGLRVSIYNHVNNWTESVPFIFEVVNKVDRPNVGANFNLCHWLKVDGDKDYRPLLRQNAAKIFLVTINGAQIGAKAWTNGLIQPLDRGDFDNRQLLAHLREAGYRGPIGLMCFGVPDDARDHLARSMRAWKSWLGGARK